MGKRGRMATEDLDVLQGLVDGVVGNRVIKGTKRIQVYEDDTETTTVVYDKSIRPDGNMISMETVPKKGKSNSKVEEVVEEDKFGEPENNADLPKTKRKYLAPNGKWVSYQRGRQLGLID